MIWILCDLDILTPCPHGYPGGAQEAPRGPERPRGPQWTPGGSEEAPGDPERPQEAPGAPEGPRGGQGTLRDSRRGGGPQIIDDRPPTGQTDREPAGDQTKKKHNTKRTSCKNLINMTLFYIRSPPPATPPAPPAPPAPDWRTFGEVSVVQDVDQRCGAAFHQLHFYLAVAPVAPGVPVPLAVPVAPCGPCGPMWSLWPHVIPVPPVVLVAPVVPVANVVPVISVAPYGPCGLCGPMWPHVVPVVSVAPCAPMCPLWSLCPPQFILGILLCEWTHYSSP